MTRLASPSYLAFLGVLCLFFAGCGDGGRAPGDSTTKNAPAGNQPSRSSSAPRDGTNQSGLPTAAISNKADNETAAVAESEALEQGSPQWLIREIMRVRVQPGPKSDDPQHLRAHRRWKNNKIISLAREAIRLTHEDPQQEKLLNVAVHHLMEARLELALQSNPDDIQQVQQYINELYSDAEALYRRDPDSKAAAEAAFIRAKFANTSAQRYAQAEPRWLQEFSRQARLFATNFPQQQSRAVSLLDAAAQSCELHRMPQEARLCYTELSRRFAETPQGRQAAAALRRLSLEGTLLKQLGGPTLDGKYVQIDDYRGRVLLLVFWASHAGNFIEQTGQLQDLQKTYGSGDFSIVGVSLDEEAQAAERFLQENPWMKTTLFWPEESQRGWQNPIVRYYGVRNIPSYWLIDRKGTVIDPLADPAKLKQQVANLIGER